MRASHVRRRSREIGRRYSDGDAQVKKNPIIGTQTPWALSKEVQQHLRAQHKVEEKI